MGVDLTAKRKILVVHGIQTGSSEDQNQHEELAKLLKKTKPGLDGTYKTDIFRYEDLNDDDKGVRALQLLLKLLGHFVAVSGPALKLAEGAIDLLGDVVINLEDGATAKLIRRKLKAKILESYDAGEPLFLVGHSLGSVYSFDVVNELMAEPDMFMRDNMETWPVQGFMSLGSPLGLSLFKRNRVQKMGPGGEFFPWRNIWDPTDPVVSGSFYGKSLQSYVIEGRFKSHDIPSGWDIEDFPISTKQKWLLAHVAYWKHDRVGEELGNMLIT